MKDYNDHWTKELERCKDPVYFYENYFLLKRKDGSTEKPRKLTEDEKIQMRVWAGIIDPNKSGSYNSPM